MVAAAVLAVVATVAVRKIGIAAIGVFGAAMETMQVHLTMAALLVVIMMTSHVEPFANVTVDADAAMVTFWFTIYYYGSP